MKRKAAVRYLLHSYRNPLLIFYGIILLVSLLVCTLMEVQVAGEGKVSSVNGASVIFLFVCGLNAFKEDFCFFLFLASGRPEFSVKFCRVIAFEVSQSVPHNDYIFHRYACF